MGGVIPIVCFKAPAPRHGLWLLFDASPNRLAAKRGRYHMPPLRVRLAEARLRCLRFFWGR